jgi:hypothetical protein
MENILSKPQNGTLFSSAHIGFKLFTFVVSRASHIHMNSCVLENIESMIIGILQSVPGDFAFFSHFAQCWFE